MLSAYLLLVIFTIFGALGGFFLKRATSDTSGYMGLIKNRNLHAGFLFYFLSAVINIVVLQLLPYSVVLPCSAITYVWSLLLSRKYLREYVGSMKITGVVLVIAGTAIIVYATA